MHGTDPSNDPRRLLLLGAVIALADSGDGAVGLLELVPDGASAEDVERLEHDLRSLVEDGLLTAGRAPGRALVLEPTTLGQETWRRGAAVLRARARPVDGGVASFPLP